MTRQRIRPSLKRSVYQDCPHCHGTGQVKTCESMSIDVMRMLQLAAHRPGTITGAGVGCGGRGPLLAEQEAQGDRPARRRRRNQVSITGKPGVPPEMLEFVCYDNNNNEIKSFSNEDRAPAPRR